MIPDTIEGLKAAIKSTGDMWIRLALKNELQKLRRAAAKHDRSLSA